MCSTGWRLSHADVRTRTARPLCGRRKFGGSAMVSLTNDIEGMPARRYTQSKICSVIRYGSSVIGRGLSGEQLGASDVLAGTPGRPVITITRPPRATPFEPPRRPADP